MQVPSFCGVHGMPSTVGNSLGPPPYTAPDCGGEGATACPPPEVPLTQTPAKSLGTVPLGHAEAGAAVAHRPTPTNRAQAPATRKILMRLSLASGAGVAELSTSNIFSSK